MLMENKGGGEERRRRWVLKEGLMTALSKGFYTGMLQGLVVRKGQKLLVYHLICF